MAKIKNILPKFGYIFGFFIVAIISHQLLLRSKFKLFWTDEANEIFSSCSPSYWFTIKNGAGSQCSPAPFYYLIQKFIVGHSPLFDVNILVSYRLISLVSATLVLIGLFYFFSRRLGSIWGLLALVMINNQPIFHQFAAENRPYLFWVFLFTATVYLVSSISAEAWFRISQYKKLCLVAASLALALTSGAGMVQFAGLCFVFIVFENKKSLFNRESRQRYKYIFSLAVVVAALGLYYAMRGCPQHYAAQWDLLVTKDWGLVQDVASLLFPIQGSVITLVFNFLFMAGALIPFAWWRRRSQLNRQEKFVFALTTASAIQIVLTFPLGFLVARAHYYFVPRIFIYLIILRVFLVVCGGWLVFTRLSEKSQSRARKVMAGAGASLMILGLLGSIYKSNKAVELFMRESAGRWPQIEKDFCQIKSHQVVVTYQNSDDVSFKLNFLLRANEELKKCGWKPNVGPVVYLKPLQIEKERRFDFQVFNERPPGSTSSYFIHKALTFD